MKLSESKRKTVIWIVILLVAVEIGNFVMEWLYALNTNVWLARCAGTLAAAMSGLLLQYLWERHNKSSLQRLQQGDR